MVFWVFVIFWYFLRLIFYVDGGGGRQRYYYTPPTPHFQPLFFNFLHFRRFAQFAHIVFVHLDGKKRGLFRKCGIVRWDMWEMRNNFSRAVLAISTRPRRAYVTIGQPARTV